MRVSALTIVKGMNYAVLVRFSSKVVLLLDDKEADVRKLAVWVLRRLDAKDLTPHISKVAIHAEHKDAGNRVFALKSLAKLEPAQLSEYMTPQTLVYMLEDPDEGVRLAAAKTLAVYPPSEVANLSAALLQVFLDEKRDLAVRQTICTKMIPHLRPEAIHNVEGYILPHIEQAYINLDSPDWKLRKEGCEILAAFPNLSSSDKVYAQGLLKKLEDPRFEVSRAAANALAKRPPAFLALYVDTFINKIPEAHEGARMGAVQLLNLLYSYDGLLNRHQIGALLRVGRE